GCQTAIAVASLATEMIRGKTASEALALSSQELSAPLGALPPMKIHCAQLVEEALQAALAPEKKAPSSQTSTALASTLVDQLQPPQGKIKIRVIPKH
ncbi:MAG: FeS assembly protein, partial [Verrucomicrobia bacterium]